MTFEITENQYGRQSYWASCYAYAQFIPSYRIKM